MGIYYNLLFDSSFLGNIVISSFAILQKVMNTGVSFYLCFPLPFIDIMGWLGGVLRVMVKFLRVAKYFRNCMRYCAFS